MKEIKNDPHTAERIRMENLGRIFVLFLLVGMIIAGHFLLNL